MTEFLPECTEFLPDQAALAIIEVASLRRQLPAGAFILNAARDRQAEYRLRQILGQRVFKLVLGEFNTVNFLLDRGFLTLSEAEDPTAVDTALSIFIEQAIANEK